MKKILFFIVLIIFIIPLKVYGLENVEYFNHNYYICDENNNSYHIYLPKYKGKIMYMINLIPNMSTNFDNYELLSYSDSGYDPSIQDYLGVMIIVNYMHTYLYYYEFMTRYLWENIYPDKTFYFCKESSSILKTKEEQYAGVKKRVDEVLNGIDEFNNIYYQKSNEEKLYDIDYLRFYDLIDKDNTISYKGLSDLHVKGVSGTYNLGFVVSRYEGEKDILYSDGTTILALAPRSREDIYNFKVIIEPYMVSISFDNNIDEGIKFKLYDEENNFIKDIVVYNNIAFNIEGGKYYLRLEDNDKYEDMEIFIDTNNEENLIQNLELKEKIIDDIENEINNEETNSNEVINETIIEENTINNDNISENISIIENSINEEININNNEELKKEEDNKVYINGSKYEDKIISFIPKNTFI